MTKKYFLIGTVVAIICSIIEGTIIMGPKFFNLFIIFNSSKEKYNSLIPITAGVLVLLLAAFIFDRLSLKPRLWSHGIAIPTFIFILGTATGSLVNFIVNAKPGEFFDYFMKPFYWVSVVGIPSAILVGLVYYFFTLRRTVEP